MSEVFITFLILTYRRPQKLARLLEIFVDERWHSIRNLNCEIVIVDDHGEDYSREYTAPIVENLASLGWDIRYIYRSNNVRGDRNLYYGYTQDAKGEYAWFLCDDDLLDVQLAIDYINTVYATKPLASICGFTQGHNGQYGNRLGIESKLICDFAEAIDYLIKFPKTTAYLLKRSSEDNMDMLIDRWDNTMYSWIGITIFLLAKSQNQSLLIYPYPVARADDDYGVLRYSFRTFGNLYFVVRDSVELSGRNFGGLKTQLKNLVEQDQICLCINGLAAHYNHKNEVKYIDNVVIAEQSYLKANWANIVRKPIRVYYLLKLIVHYIKSYALNR